MARIRSIKPEFWSSPGIESLDPYARLLYIAMWNWADDNGVGVANPRELLGFAFPLDEEITLVDVRRMLVEIRRVFDVDFYKVKGRPYYSIPSWEEHQKFDRRSKGKYPTPDQGEEWDPASDLRKLHPAEPSADTRGNPTSPRRDSVAGTGEQGNRGTGESYSPTTVRSPAASPKIQANRIVNSWLDGLEKRPPTKSINDALSQIVLMVQDGIEEKHMLAGLEDWWEGNYPASTIPNYVRVHVRGTPGKTAATPARRSSTGEDRALDILSITGPEPPDDEEPYPEINQEWEAAR